jgi:hypothetical protein
MKAKIALSASTCVLGIAAICLYVRSASQQKEYLSAKQEISSNYRDGIASLARRLAELHVRHGHAMYLGLEGPEQADPEPIHGYSVCQLGCITFVFFVGDTEASVDDCFPEEYSRYLEKRAALSSSPRVRRPRPAGVRRRRRRVIG